MLLLVEVDVIGLFGFGSSSLDFNGLPGWCRVVHWLKLLFDGFAVVKVLLLLMGLKSLFLCMYTLPGVCLEIVQHCLQGSIR